MFVGKAKAALKGASLGLAPLLHSNSREGWGGFTKDKHSSLLRTLKNDERKKFYNIGHDVNLMKIFTVFVYK
jgi:hypothetical protein